MLEGWFSVHSRGSVEEPMAREALDMELDCRQGKAKASATLRSHVSLYLFY